VPLFFECLCYIVCVLRRINTASLSVLGQKDELPPSRPLPFLSSPLPMNLLFPPFRSRPLNRCKLPQWGLVLSPSRQTIWCILESKNAALVAAVFVDFPKNKCNFMPKNKLDIVRRVQFLTGRRPMRNFFRGAVATIAQYGSRGSRRLHCHEKKCQVAPKKVPIRCPKNDTL